MRITLFLLAAPLCFPQAQPPPPPPSPAAVFESERLQQLMNVRRIFVDKLGGTNADQIRDLLIASLQGAKIFILTENAERADATLRGSAEDLIYTDTYQYQEGANSRGSGSATSGTGVNRRGISSAIGLSENESARIAERRHEAIATLRLVNKEGDVIWSTTQESRGAKFRGAAADVAEKVARSLMSDYDKARKPPPAR
ncbi:MAG: hypothetical protein JNL62_09055 [Bryobacterales bacterium]|nr:hypothetical protein [Bryobacterales bacterium]